MQAISPQVSNVFPFKGDKTNIYPTVRTVGERAITVIVAARYFGPDPP